MSRPSGLTIVMAAALALVVAWVASNTEWGEVELPTRLRGEAATNPFYAAQKLVEMLGATSERRESLGGTSRDAVVVLSTWAWDVEAERRAELEQWVEDGGRLVVDASLITGSDAFEQWSGITRERDAPEEDGDLFQAPAIVEPCREVEETPAEDGTVAGTFEVCDFDTASWLETSERTLWALEDDGYLVAARVRVGRGSVTVLNGVPFVFRELFEGEHGELLAAATGLRAGDHVVFMTEVEVASLLELVWRHGAPVVLTLLLFIALALWRGATRFGPLAAPAERARRSLGEQIRGTGRFAERLDGGTALLAAARRAVHEAAMRRVAGYEAQSPEQQAAVVAPLAAVEAAELQAALVPAREQRPQDLRSKLALLESVRRQLVSGSQWSKHGKRI